MSGAWVAPRAGAWIETDGMVLYDSLTMSPLAQGRGLKLFDVVPIVRLDKVAPRAGAWIET